MSRLVSLDETTNLINMENDDGLAKTHHNDGNNRCQIRYRWFLSSLVFIGYLIVHVMRFCLGMAIVAMVKTRANHSEANVTASCPVDPRFDETATTKHYEGELDWDLYTQSHVLGAFSYGYIVANILGGRAVELIGVKWCFGAGTCLTALLTLLTPILARWSYVAVILARILEGLGEGLVIPCIPVFLSRWIPKNERTFIYSVIHAAGSIGTVVSFALTGYLCDTISAGGWPLPFYIYGSAGLIWCLIWLPLMCEYPDNHRWISREEVTYILKQLRNEKQTRKQRDLPWKSILTSVPVWSCALVLFGSLWGSNLIHDEQPTFLKNIFHFKTKTNGFLSALPSLSNALIVSVAGFVSDRISEKEMISDSLLRKILTCLGGFLPALCMVGVALSGCHVVAVESFLVLSVGFLAFISPGILVAIVNLAPMFSGTITGLCNGLAQISGFLAPLVAGILVKEEQTLEQWHTIFYIAAVIYIVPAIVFLIFGSSELQPWAKDDSTNSSDE